MAQTLYLAEKKGLMCGLFGYHVRKWDPRLTTAMAILATVNENRGVDAHGWTNGKVIFKDHWPITMKFGEIPFEGEKVSAFHTRAGTSGPKNGQECAHPWAMGDVIGMHNRYIANHKELNEKYKRKFPVDSMHMVAHVSEKRDLEEIQFSGVFLYFVNGEGPFVFRTASRSLEIACLKNNLGIVWSSEFLHLRRALDMAKLPSAHFYKVLDTNRLYQLDHTNLLRHDIEIKLGDLPTPKPTKAEPDFQRYFANGNYHEDDTKEVIPDNKPKPDPVNFRRKANIGQWRKLGSEKEASWVPCYHKGNVKVKNFPATFTCGCAENDKYSTSWPTVWRPIGTWHNGGWQECWHFDGNSQCKCIPFAPLPKKQPVSQEGGRDADGTNVAIGKVIGPGA